MHVGKGQELSEQFKRTLSRTVRVLFQRVTADNKVTSELLYSVCDKSSKIFYWNDKHPTHEGCEVVMKQLLEKPLREFVDKG